MPTCPYCNADSPRLKKKKCPECEREVYVFEGHWYQKNPSLVIMDRFAELLSKKLSAKKEMTIVFRFKTKSAMYRYSVAKAKQILRECDYDLSLTLDCLDMIFADERYNWRISDSLAQVQPALPTVLSIIKAQRAQNEKSKERSKAFEEILKERDDILYG